MIKRKTEYEKGGYTHFFEIGGSKLKCGDVVTAASTYAVLQILIAFPITLVAFPALGVTMYVLHHGTNQHVSKHVDRGLPVTQKTKNSCMNATLRIIALTAFTKSQWRFSSQPLQAGHP